MAQTVFPGVVCRLGATERRDAWWAGPLATALGLGAFVVYTTVRAVWNADYQWESLLSPLYSPLILWKGMPAWLSPAFLILWAPAGFRLTCYYYRKAYYRAFFADPPACAVGESRGDRYAGERGLFLFQNLHRYFMYIAVLFILILGYDAIAALSWPRTGGGRELGVSLGTLVLTVNVILLAAYTFGCHSLRHLAGGRFDCFTCLPGGTARHRLWQGITWLNERHQLFAWLSLFWVGFADFYVWMVAAGVFTDVRIV